MKYIIYGLIFALIIVTGISLVSASYAAESWSEDNIAFNDNPIHCPYGANRTFGDISNKNTSILSPDISFNHTDYRPGGTIWEEHDSLINNS